MKICLAGGSAARASVLAAALRSRGHEVAVESLPSWGALAGGRNALIAGLWRHYGAFDVVHVFDTIALRLLESAFDGAFPCARVTHVRADTDVDAWAQEALSAYARAAMDGRPRTSHWDRYGSRASYSEGRVAGTYDAQRFTTTGGLAFDAIERAEVDAALAQVSVPVDVHVGTAPRTSTPKIDAGHVVVPHDAGGDARPPNAGEGAGPQDASVGARPPNAGEGAGPPDAGEGAGPHDAGGGPGPNNAGEGAGSRNAGGGPGPHNADGESGPRNAGEGTGPRNAGGGPGPHNAGEGAGSRNAGGGPGPHNAGEGAGSRNAGGGPGPHNAGEGAGSRNAGGGPGPHNADGGSGPRNAGGGPGPHNADGGSGPRNPGGGPWPHTAGKGAGPHDARPYDAGGDARPRNAGGDAGPHGVGAGAWPHERGAETGARSRVPLRVLDVGAGTARFASHLARAGHCVVASEVSGPMLVQARARLASEGTAERVRVVQGDGYALPFRDGAFDAVTAIRVLNQIYADDDKAALVAEMFRVVRPGGRVVFDIINARSLARLRQPAGLISVAGACALVDAAGGDVTHLSGRLVLTETLLHVCPAPLVPLAARLDALVSRVLGGLATRIYVTAVRV